jgi:hypothetical protein
MLIPELSQIPQRLGHISLALLPTNGLHIRPANNMQVVMNAAEAPSSPPSSSPNWPSRTTTPSRKAGCPG